MPWWHGAGGRLARIKVGCPSHRLLQAADAHVSVLTTSCALVICCGDAIVACDASVHPRARLSIAFHSLHRLPCPPSPSTPSSYHTSNPFVGSHPSSPTLCCSAASGLPAPYFFPCTRRISPSLAWIQLGCWGCAVASKLYLAFVGPGYVSLPAAGAFKCKCAARKPLVVKNSNNYLDVPACPTCGPTACENCGGLPSALWCATCERPKPATAEHCFVCNKCVDHYDHHCNLIDNCIGGRNYYAFVSLLGCSLGAIATGCACTILYVHDTVKHVTLTFTCHPYPGNTPIVFPGDCWCGPCALHAAAYAWPARSLRLPYSQLASARNVERFGSVLLLLHGRLDGCLVVCVLHLQGLAAGVCKSVVGAHCVSRRKLRYIEIVLSKPTCTRRLGYWYRRYCRCS